VQAAAGSRRKGKGKGIMNLSHALRGLRVSSSPGWSVVCLCIILCLSTTPAWTQATSTSTVTGLVTDQQNATIPGVEVKLLDRTTNSALTTTTNDAGRYIFVNVPSGTYALTFTKAGFSAYRVDEVKLEVGSSITINPTLQIGSTATTVEVSATMGAELQTANATVGNTITQNSIMFLPNLGRDVQTLAVLQPGVTSSGYTAGAYMDQNTYMLDGGNTSDDMAGNTIGYQTNFTGLGGGQTSNFATGVVPTPVESVEEVRVSVFGQGADFNNSSGANVQMVTKRGTNQYHGSGYGFYYATNLGAANSWTADHTPSNIPGFGPLSYTPLVPNHRTRFGAISRGGDSGPQRRWELCSIQPKSASGHGERRDLPFGPVRRRFL